MVKTMVFWSRKILRKRVVGKRHIEILLCEDVSLDGDMLRHVKKLLSERPDHLGNVWVGQNDDMKFVSVDPPTHICDWESLTILV